MWSAAPDETIPDLPEELLATTDRLQRRTRRLQGRTRALQQSSERLKAATERLRDRLQSSFPPPPMDVSETDPVEG